MSRKTYKHKSYKKKGKKNKTIKKIMKGGVIREIPVTSILMTDPIKNAIKKLNPEFIIKGKGFKGYPGEHGFNLKRLGDNHNLTIPISVKPYKSTSFYTIEDGRHRFAKLVARGDTTIIVDINE